MEKLYIREILVQQSIAEWLKKKGYRINRITPTVSVARHGIDIKAYNKAGQHYFIECKGETKGENSHLSFIEALGQTLLMMSAGEHEWKKYAIGIPETREFRNQYAKFLKLPLNLRKQLKISFFFINSAGSVIKEKSW